MKIFLAFFFLVFPALVIWLCSRVSFLNKVGAVILCYIVGITLGNSGLLSEASRPVQEMLSEGSVALAMPLLLFSMDVRLWLKIAGKSMLCMLGATLSILLVSALSAYLASAYLQDAWKLGGMAIGVYTGGTPNLAAVKEALSVDPTTFIIMHTYDTLASFVYLVFCMTAAQRLFQRWLPRFVRAEERLEEEDVEKEEIHSYAGIFSSRILLPLTGALALAALVVAGATAASRLFPQAYVTPVAILLITTAGVAASFVGRIRTIQKTFQLGMYLIFVFCLVVGSMVNFKDLVQIHWPIMALVFSCIFGSFLLHAVFCRLFVIDTDTFIITSVSAICSPPFILPVAGALRNREILLSGIITGIVGYAIGNYLGISFAYLFRSFCG